MSFAHRIGGDPDLVELLEDVGQLIGGDADAGVLPIDAKALLPETLAAHPHDAPRGVRYGIAHEIAQDLTEEDRIAGGHLRGGREGRVRITPRGCAPPALPYCG